MHPQITYELRVSFPEVPTSAVKTKQKLLDWLLMNGVESFVEGSLDVDINQNQEEPPRDYYTELGGDLTPVSIYRYGKESLDDLRAKLDREFGRRIESALHTMQTETWMEGWKESFKPFATDAFFVRPPWITDAVPAGLKEIVVEPGMAFGTGQHATTRLCLEQLGRVARLQAASGLSPRRVFDVGTGTGILAIGARRLGYGPTLGTDIEDDAILASRANAAMNDVDVEFVKGSIPKELEPADLVFANILAVVLLKMMPELARVTRPYGYLILSGLLVEEEAEIIERAEVCGFQRDATQHLNGWSCVVVRRKA
jgi:ribosomal protein L11 methyltransferase